MKTKLRLLRLVLLAFVTVILRLSTASIQAGTLPVYNNNDSDAGSLRAALAAAANGDTIDATGVSGTILLTSGELLVTNNVTILGPGPAILAVDGNAASRVFHFTNVTATVSGLTITNGRVNVASLPDQGGAGIFNDRSILTVSNCAVSGNSAIGSSGAYSLGGGIFNYATNGSTALSLIACSFSGNKADYGGGVQNYDIDGSAMLSVTACTFNSNSATYSGGGIYNDAYGGSATLSMAASTLYNNLAGSGGGVLSFSADGPSTFGSTTVLIVGCTFGENRTNNIYLVSVGSDIGSFEIWDTILKVLNPNDFTSPNIDFLGSSFTSSEGYNLSNDGAGGFLTNATDRTYTNPMLGPLQDNGGPTLTLGLLPGSPAIDKGKSFGLTIDQRGQPRPFDNPAIANEMGGDGSDIGAVEAQNGDLFPIFVSNTNDSGAGSLRQVLVAAVPGETIEIQSNVVGTITLTSGELLVTNPITILGPGAGALAINGNHAYRIFHINPNMVATICGLTITNGSASPYGGGIFNDEATLTLSNCTVSGNSASAGGGIYNNGEAGSATLAVLDCFINGNTAVNGGGLFNSGFNGGHATMTVNASALSGNTANGGFGAGIDNVGTSGSVMLTLSNSTLYNNSAGVDGGAIFSTGQSGGLAALTVFDSTICSNSAGTLGGGIFNNINSTLTIGDTILKTGAAGANIVNSSGSVVSDGYNLSSDNGGGLLAATGDQIGIDPLLGPLQDNGGPTPTMALLPGSPAIDKGKSFGLTTDQRGAPRPFDFASIANASGGDGSDIGAFELGSPTLHIQQVGNSAVLSWPSYYGEFSLQSSTNIASSNAWVLAGGSPDLVGSQYQQTNSPISGSKFFRLKSN